MNPYIRTLDDFQKAISIGQTTESRHLDFKQDLDAWAAAPGPRREGQKEFCRDVSQFANTSGGCLLIGIGEARVDDAKLATGIVGVDDFDGRRAWMEQAVQNFLLPPAFGMGIERIVTDLGPIVAVNVPPSEYLVKLWDPEARTVQAFRRTNHGKQAMHPDEMEAHTMNSRRAAKLAFERVLTQLPDVTQVELVSGVWAPITRSSGTPPSVERAPDPDVSLGSITEHEFELRIRTKFTPQTVPTVPTIRIPFGLLREAWATADRRIGLFLHVRVFQRRDSLALEPF